MLQRLFVHLTFILLFAFTQIGVATHEISHITDRAKHSQSDENTKQKNTTAEQCAQCISYAKVASGLLPSILHTDANHAGLITSFSKHSSLQHYASSPYAARAPPQTNRI